MSETPVHPRPRRLANWINPTDAKKVHSLIDKVYKRKNLEMAWEKVKANRGSGGVDGQTLKAFAEQLDPQLDRLQSELIEETYEPQPVRQVQIPKAGKPGEFRTLGVPTIYDRVCQQALLNRLEPIFEPVFDEANFGYGEGDRRRTPCAKFGRRFRAGGSGSWMQT
jgi:RNA-directed DNA polymerase